MNYLEIGYWSIIFTTAYVNRMSLLKWCNYNYVILREKWEDLNKSNKIKNVEKIIIDDKTFYKYVLFNNTFIGFNENFKNIDTEDLTKNIESLKTPSLPEHIISAEMTIIDDMDKTKTIDILEHTQELCGPYIDQIKEENKDYIRIFLLSNYINISKIEKVEIMFTDGEEETLNF